MCLVIFKLQYALTDYIVKKLFKLRRAEQLAAVKGLRTLGDGGKQKKMILAITEKVFAVSLLIIYIISNQNLSSSFISLLGCITLTFILVINVLISFYFSG